MSDQGSVTNNAVPYLNFSFSKPVLQLASRTPEHVTQIRNNKQNKQNMQCRNQIYEHELAKLESKLNLTQIHAEKVENVRNDLQQFAQKQAVMIDQLKVQIEQKTEEIRALNEELQTRKKTYEDIINQLRKQNTDNREKIVRVVGIVSSLEIQIEALTKQEQISFVTEEGLRKRIEQLTQHNEELSRRIAKAEVNSEKYKLKALEGEKYWSGKLELLKQKQQESTYLHLKENESKHSDRNAFNVSEILRLNRLLAVKEEFIQDLQKRMQQILILQ